MSSIILSIILILIVLCLIYMTKKLLDTEKMYSDTTAYILIPISNDTTNIKKKIKAEYWNSVFIEKDKKEILLVPTEELKCDTKEYIKNIVKKEKLIKIISKEELINML